MSMRSSAAGDTIGRGAHPNGALREQGCRGDVEHRTDHAHRIFLVDSTLDTEAHARNGQRVGQADRQVTLAADLKRDRASLAPRRHDRVSAKVPARLGDPLTPADCAERNEPERSKDQSVWHRLSNMLNCRWPRELEV